MDSDVSVGPESLLSAGGLPRVVSRQGLPLPAPCSWGGPCPLCATWLLLGPQPPCPISGLSLSICEGGSPQLPHED